MITFNDLGLDPVIVQSLEKMNITSPTEIQRESIPIALQGEDLLATAQTGTGKTLSFLIPVITKLLENPEFGALILTPTRELAVQVKTAAHNLLSRTRHLEVAALIGGEPMFRQMQQLRRNPRIIVGTPGRIQDHINRKSISLANTKVLVLDEIDRMLDMGFSEQLEKISKFLPVERQTLMFSATFPPAIEKASKKYLKQHKRVSVGSTTQASAQIKQEIIKTKPATKFDDLMLQLASRDGSKIIFVKTKIGASKLAEKLRFNKLTADAIHGDLRQRKRELVLRDFSKNKIDILVATDVAARGIDVKHVKHVINFDLPQCPEDYIHRIGRTGRAGAEGFAVSLISPEDNILWSRIQRLMNNEDVGDRSIQRRSPRSGGGGRRFGNGGGSSSAPRRSSSSRFGGGGEGSRSSFSERRSFGGGDRSSSSSEKRGFGEKRSYSDGGRPSGSSSAGKGFGARKGRAAPAGSSPSRQNTSSFSKRFSNR